MLKVSMERGDYNRAWNKVALMNEKNPVSLCDIDY